MINAKKYDKLIVIEGNEQKELKDVVVIPVWLLRSLLRYEDDLLKEDRNSLTDYGKGIYDTLKEQHTSLSINTERK